MFGQSAKWLCVILLFVSFGSGGTLSHDQILELAMGLAMSGHRFIWVVRYPNNDSADAGYLTENGHVDPHVFFTKRVHILIYLYKLKIIFFHVN